MSRWLSAALDFKEKIFFNLNTPLYTAAEPAQRLLVSEVHCGTDRAGADTGQCESRPSQGADSYDTRVVKRLWVEGGRN